MQLTIFTDYGLRCLMYLAAHPDKKTTVREITEYYHISHNHVVKVVHRLVQLGYITSSKGKGGGITLACHANKMRLGDIVKMLEPNVNLVECFDTVTNTCRISTSCQMKHYFHEAFASFLATLNKYTLADIVKKTPFPSKILT